MFFQIPEEESQIVKSVPNRKKNKKPKKKKNKKRILNKEIQKRQTKFSDTMSAWADNFAIAATWQLKHQVAYWKARAKALEYENSVLHDVIRRNHLKLQSTSNTESEYRTETEIDKSDYESSSNDEENEGNGFEVSEEFIQFLMTNAKYKEDAKKERERLQAKEDVDELLSCEQPRESLEECRDRMKELYGDKWQRISALEMSLLSSFIHESDTSKPQHWPNIPFNFNYG